MSLYNNCSHQNWHLVITQYIEAYNECHKGGLSFGLIHPIATSDIVYKGSHVLDLRSSLSPGLGTVVARTAVC